MEIRVVAAAEPSRFETEKTTSYSPAAANAWEGHSVFDADWPSPHAQAMAWGLPVVSPLNCRETPATATVASHPTAADSAPVIAAGQY